MRAVASPKFWIGIGISVACLWLAIRDVPFSEFGRSLASASYIWLLPAIVLQFLAVLPRAQRWIVLLGKEDRLADSFWAQSIGYLFTNTFPFRLGEPARIIVMSQRCRLPFVQVAASAVVERFLDVAIVLLFLVVVLPLMHVPDIVTRAGIYFGAVILLALTILLLAIRFDQWCEKLLHRVCEWCRFLPAGSIVARWRELIDGLRQQMGMRVAGAAGWSLVTWILAVVTEWLVIRTFQPNGSIVEAAFVIVALAFAVSVPSSPGFIGVFQFVGQQALVLPFAGKYDIATALAITLTGHLLYYLTTSILGVIGVWRLGESVSHLGRLVAAGRPAPTKL